MRGKSDPERNAQVIAEYDAHLKHLAKKYGLSVTGVRYVIKAELERRETPKPEPEICPHCGCHTPCAPY